MGTDMGVVEEGSDFSESYTEGDPVLGDIDPAELILLESLTGAIQANTAEGSAERNMANLQLLSEMYGDDLVVL